MSPLLKGGFVVTIMFFIVSTANASPLLDQYTREAKEQRPSFEGFSALRGKTLFFSRYTEGKSATPSCTSCHTRDPLAAGLTRAGKIIAPMALSRSPDRYEDPMKVEKWFRRNCKSVLGRKCTSMEKGDFITFMSSK